MDVLLGTSSWAALCMQMISKKQHERLNVAPINLNGDPLPWVTSVKHLGNILECSNTMKQDCSAKRGNFVGKIINLGQEFSMMTAGDTSSSLEAAILGS